MQKEPPQTRHAQLRPTERPLLAHRTATTATVLRDEEQQPRGMVPANSRVELEQLRPLALVVQRRQDIRDGGRVLQTQLLRLVQQAARACAGALLLLVLLQRVEDGGRNCLAVAAEEQAVQIAVALVVGEVHEDLAREPGRADELRDALGCEGGTVGKVLADETEVVLKVVEEGGELREGRVVVEGQGAG